MAYAFNVGNFPQQAALLRSIGHVLVQRFQPFQFGKCSLGDFNAMKVLQHDCISFIASWRTASGRR